MSTSTPTIAITPAQSTVEEMYAAFGRGDVAGILAGCAAEVEWIGNGPQNVIPYCGSRRGVAGVAEFFKVHAASEEIIEFVPDVYVASGDLVAVRGHEIGIAKTTGKQFSTPWLHLFTFRGSQCVRWEACYDSAAVVAAYTK
ncbi:MAG: nuclear transport factor 2 family protein [bacterium]